MEACILDSSSENTSLVYRQQIDPHNTKYVLVHGVRLILENRHEANEFLNAGSGYPFVILPTRPNSLHKTNSMRNLEVRPQQIPSHNNDL